MKLTIEKDQFIEGLTLAHNIADRKSTMQILANVLIRTDGTDSIICAATDLKVSAITRVNAAIQEEGLISIGAKHLFDIVKSLPSGKISLTKTENNRAKIEVGNAKYKVFGLDGKDFPKLPEQDSVEFFEVDASILSEMIKKTAFSVATDETRHHLNGIFMSWKDETVTMASTDGHRLSKIERKIGNGLNVPDGIIIPRKGAIELKKLLDGSKESCSVGIHNGSIFVQRDNVCLTIKLADANFPPVDTLIPQESEKVVEVDRALFLDCIKRMLIVSSEESGAIRFNLKPGELHISGDSQNLGEGKEYVAVEYAGEEFSVGFNAKYFIEPLAEMNSEKSLLCFNGELDPGAIRPKGDDGHVCIVMPLRI